MTLNKKYLLFVYFAVILLYLNVFSATAGLYWSNVDSNGNRDNVPYRGICTNPKGQDHEYIFKVKLKNLDDVTFDNTEMNLLRNEPLWKTWTFQNSTQPLIGSFDVVRYDAGLFKKANWPWVFKDTWDDNIKFYFQVDYDIANPPPLPPGYKWAWIQIIYHNLPEWSSSPRVDPYGNNYQDGLPFYFTSNEMTNNNFDGLTIYGVAPTLMSFYDSPWYPLANAIKNDIKPSFEAHLYVAAWNQAPPETVIVYYNGLKWGYDITWTDEGATPLHGDLRDHKAGGVAGDKPGCDTIEESEPLYGIISVTKYGPASARVGQTINYIITVINPSSVTTMSKVSVVDSLLGDISGSFSASLSPSTSEFVTFTYTVPYVPLENTVTVTYKDDLGDSHTASDTWTIETVHAPVYPVGGVVVPVDKFGLLAPYIGLASTILVATVATAIYTKRVKRRKEEQE